MARALSIVIVIAILCNGAGIGVMAQNTALEIQDDSATVLMGDGFDVRLSRSGPQALTCNSDLTLQKSLNVSLNVGVNGQVSTGSLAVKDGVTMGKLTPQSLLAASVTRDITSVSPTVVFPNRAMLWAETAQAHLSAGAVTPTFQPSQIHTVACFVAGADTASGYGIQWSFPLAAGSYTVRVLGVTGSNQGILSWSMDGTTFASGDDYYSAAQTFNIQRQFTPVTVTGNGQHLLRALVTGKNGLASAFAVFLTRVSITPITTDATVLL